MTRINPHVVVFVVYPDVKLLDLAGPLQVFSDAVNDDGERVYRPIVASMAGASVQTDTCVSLDCEPLSDFRRRKIDTLILVGGSGVVEALKDENLINELSRLSARSTRIGSVCSGAFLLASCGLLDGRSATTHWESVDKLERDFPNIQVEPNSIFVKDGKLWTSAGVTAGIDMALAMVAEDLGKSVALSLARSLVTFLIRPGGQSQFSTVLQLQTSDSGALFDELHSWVQSNLDKNLSIEVLAGKANMSSRHFSRRYRVETGQTPAKAVEVIRVEAARRMLQDGILSVAAVARRCGFRDDERMRRSFIRLLKVPPSSYLKSSRRG